MSVIGSIARNLLCIGLLALSAAWAGATPPDHPVLSEGFEGELPDFHTYQATYAADETRARSGKRSLRVTPTGTSGGAYFKLQKLIDAGRDYEFSVWAHASSADAVRLYISASDGKSRQTKGTAVRAEKAGDWVRFVGHVRAKEWKATDQEIMLAMSASRESWFDDAALVATTLPDPPIEVYPRVEALLRAEADKRPVRLSRGKRITLHASAGALAPDLAREVVVPVTSETLPISPDGLLTFAVDASEPVYVTGSLSLTPDKDLRPGLRATVLCNSTVVAAPVVQAAAWQGVGNALIGPAPEIAGSKPADRVALVEWLLPKGRSYLTLAGPHFRPGGTFRGLELRALRRRAGSPSYRFALLSDTHMAAEGRAEWMNVKMDGAVAPELATDFASLSKEGADFVLMAGDMSDRGTREDIAAVAGLVASARLPVYGCIGNHDAFRATSRPDILELAGTLFPGGKTDYVLSRPPLRFIVLDASSWRTRDGEILPGYDAKRASGIGLRPEQIEWLRKTLAEDTTTPTVVVWHYAFTNRGGLSAAGFRMPAAACVSSKEVLGILDATPNVVATLCGHAHWNEVNRVKRITHLQNASIAEWPNAYRVFRVYPDRLEWETRQVGNRGFIREGFIAPKALAWMLSTGDGDLAGEVRY